MNGIGVKGYYDFDVRWSGQDAQDGQDRAAAFGDTDYVAGIIPVLQEQFGLRVTNATGPVEYWVVDHVELPTGN